MRTLMLVLAFLPVAAVAGERDPANVRTAPMLLPSGKVCERTRPEMAAPPFKPVEPRSLGREPTAGQHQAVLRTVGGCELPTKIRDGIGDSRDDQR
ncbi:hypothetical protein ACMGDH_05780 [Sphingomonas sp. DT-207]|uniref:hypothetical protein n=1 Tax=Sphingomonas sp. DT-207 TaxID=3396167 RepID=UPI003F1A8073